LTLWQTLALLRRPGSDMWRWLLLGLTLGFAGLTKLSTGTALPLVVAGLAFAAWQEPQAKRGRYLLARLAAIGLPALLLLAPWLLHNVAVYGLGDPLVLKRHEAVVVGQLRTADWLQQVGWRRALGDFSLTTFHSFWGQFGWMGVPIDDRIYRGLAILSGLAVLGLALRTGRREGWGPLEPPQRAGLALLAGSILLGGASLIGYNLTFVQHQGRYLFPSLIPLGIFLAAGWHEITRRPYGLAVAALLLLGAALLASRNALAHRSLDKWTLAGLTAGSGSFALNGCLPETWGGWLYAVPYLLLVILDLACLYGFILPALA